MAKKGSNPKKETLARIQRTEAYAEKVRLMFAQTVNDILALNKTMPTLDEGVMYSFDGESLKKQKEVERLLRRLHSSATMAIQQGIKLEWEQANVECDKLIESAFGKKVLSNPKFSAWTNRNEAARDAFISRTEKGMNLSDRIWKPVRQLRDEMEVAMTVSIGEGESASSMSRKVRSYLNDPDLMFRRFRYKDDAGEWQRKWKKRIKDEETGKYRWIDYDRDDYKTGAGVYKSSAKNAMRVTRTETNIAYRRADNARWQDMDFVLGQRVQLSKSHPREDICDKLQGDYPKDFIFDGWHPQCFCFCTPILISEDEMAKVTEAALRGEKYESQGKPITDYPDSFKDWVTEHSEAIAKARQRGTEPYFITNNAQAIDNILNPEAAGKSSVNTDSSLMAAVKETVKKARAVGDEVQRLAESIAAKYEAVCTPVNYKSEASIIRKVQAERADDNPKFMPDMLKDTVRMTIIADKSKLESIINSLKKNELFLRYKPQSGDEYIGYIGNIVNIKTTKGLTAEIQVNTAKMIYAKEKPEDAKRILGLKTWNAIRKEVGIEGGLGHKYYEEWRAMSKEEQLSAKGQALKKKSEEYYAHFKD